MSVYKYHVLVTQLKLSKPFLKVFAKNISKRTNEAANRLKYLYKKETGTTISLGQTCIANMKKDRYERCRVIQVNQVDGTATLMFIDCGYQGELSMSRLRPLNDVDLRNAEPFCKEFILAEIYLVTNTKHQKILDFHDMIVDNIFEMTIVAMNEAGRYVDLCLAGNSLSNVLMVEHPVLSLILKKYPLDMQMAQMLKMKQDKDKLLKKQVIRPVTLVESPEIKLRQPFDFQEERLNHYVRVTEFDEEPFCFFVQFTHSDEEFQRFQCDLQQLKDRLESEKRLQPGNVVIAEISGHLHRATIMDSTKMLAKNEVKLELMETGQKCVVMKNQLFKMPNKVSIVPSYAKRFKLEGVDKLENGRLSVDEIEFYFKHTTKQKLLVLKVVPNGDVVVPSCHLYYENTDILNICKRYDPHMLKYQIQRPLRTGSVLQVAVSSAESPKKFFIQPIDTTEYMQYKVIEDELKRYEPPILRNPKPNDVCVVKLEKYYMRGAISGLSTSKIFKVNFVDIGFIDECNTNEIKVSVKEFMTVPPLAYRCCLSGYEDKADIGQDVIDKFHLICKNLGQVQMSIVGRKSESLVVDLEDLSDGSKVIDKLQEVDRLNLTDWTEDQPSINTHFRMREIERSDSISESICTLIESPTKTDVHGIDGWQEMENSVANSTAVSNKCLEEDDKSNDKEDWTPGPLWDIQTQVNLSNVSNEDKSDHTLIATETPKAGPPSKVNDIEPPSMSTSGVSSGEMNGLIKGEPVIISAVDSPIDFTIQKVCQAESYAEHKEKIQELAKAQAPLTIFTKGSFCLALHQFEKIWCRCVILDADTINFLISVRSLDDGMTFSIESKNELKTYPVSIWTVPSFGTKCSLPICYPLLKDSEVVNYLISIRNDHLGSEVITKFNDIFFIELFHHGKNVAETLIEMGLAKRQFIVPTGLAIVNNLLDSTKFSIQMKSSMETLRHINEYTEQYEYSNVEKPKEGMLVLGYSIKEDCWRRAKILTIGKKSFKVFFIDYGNSEIINKIGTIDESFASISPIAIRCSLFLPPHIKNLNELDEQKFRTIIEENNNIVFVNMKRPGDNFASVEIFIKGENILNLLRYGNNDSASVSCAEQVGCDEGF